MDIELNIERIQTNTGVLGRPSIYLIPNSGGQWRATLDFPVINSELITVDRLLINLHQDDYNAFYDSWSNAQAVIDLLKEKYPIETAGKTFPQGDVLENWFRNVV